MPPDWSEREKGTLDLPVTPDYQQVPLTQVVEATRKLADALKSEVDYEHRVGNEQHSASEEWDQSGHAIGGQREGEYARGASQRDDTARNEY